MGVENTIQEKQKRKTTSLPRYLQDTKHDPIRDFQNLNKIVEEYKRLGVKEFHWVDMPEDSEQVRGERPQVIAERFQRLAPLLEEAGINIVLVSASTLPPEDPKSTKYHKVYGLDAELDGVNANFIHDKIRTPIAVGGAIEDTCVEKRASYIYEKGGHPIVDLGLTTPY